MSSKEELIVESKVDAVMFREFAVFDTFRRQKRWLRPLIFAAFFCVIAAVAFSRAAEVEGAALLGGVLLAVGLGLPAVYFSKFFLSLSRRARALDPRAIAYTVTLGQGVTVKKDSQSAAYEWDALPLACRLNHSVCLYVDALHALLLRDDKGRVWETVTARMDGQRVRDCRR